MACLRPLAIALLLCALCSGRSFAAINPASPGLTKADAYGQKGIRNNGASAQCVECHTENPTAGKGSHFVMNFRTGELRRTHSGGGWDKGAWGIRENAEFFKLKPWVELEWGNGGSSKYGDGETWESVMYVGPEGAVGAEATRRESAVAVMAKMELICESCHNLRVNVDGKYRLLCKVTNSPTMDDQVEGAVAPLCVGCHGFLYQDDGGAANSLHSNWNDSRNFEPLSGKRRGNNERHYINGKIFPRNHHVMSGDAIDHPLARAGLLLRDVDVLSDHLVSKPITRAHSKGTNPVKPVPLLPIVAPTDPGGLHCVTCHAPGHRGDRTLGAALLRGEDLRGRDSGFGLDRISDGREWGRYSDDRFCGRCHG